MSATNRSSVSLKVLALLGIGFVLLGAYGIWVFRSDPHLLYSVKSEMKLYRVAFSPDSQLVATSAENGDIQLWQTANGRAIRTFQGHTGPAALAFSSDGNQLVSASQDGTVRLWDVKAGKMLNTLWPKSTRDDRFASVVFSPNRRLIVAGSEQGRVIVFQADTGAVQNNFQAYSEEVFSTGPRVWSLSMNAKSELLLTIALNGVKLWHLPDERLVKDFSHDNASWGMFSADSSTIITFVDTIDTGAPTAGSDTWSLDGRFISRNYNTDLMA